MKKTEKKSEKAKIFTLTTFILLSEAGKAERAGFCLEIFNRSKSHLKLHFAKMFYSNSNLAIVNRYLQFT